MTKVLIMEGLCNSGPRYTVIHPLIQLEGMTLRKVLAFQVRKKKRHIGKIFFFFPVFKILGFYAFYKIMPSS